MPFPALLIPIVLGGAAVAAAGYGVKKGFDAKEKFDRAETLSNEAKSTYNRAVTNLENMRATTQSHLEGLGRLKYAVYSNDLCRFVDVFGRIKNIDFTDPDLNVDPDLIMRQQELADIRDVTIRMTEMVTGAAGAAIGGAFAGVGAFGLAGVVGTASTGAAISGLAGAAATNATLAWFGGGALAAGGFGMAGGMAVLGGIVAGPVLLVGGLLLDSKADEALADARSNMRKARAAAEAMESACSAARAILERVKEIHSVLEELSAEFGKRVDALEALVGRDTDYRSYSRQEKALVGAAAAFARTVKNVMETPVFDDAGVVTEESRRMLGTARDFLRTLEKM